MKKVRCAVVGVGMGICHIQNYQNHAQADLVAIADVDEERLRARGEEYKVEKRYTDACEMLAKEELDVVSVVTPNFLHKDLTIAALEAGCHVLCEKPMAMNAAEAREMLAVAKRVDRRLMIDFSYRFNEQSWSLKKQVDSGILGKVYFARTIWHRRRGMPRFGGWFGQKDKSGGGPLIDLGVHRLDLALWLMGYPKPTWVMGSTYNPIAAERAKCEGKTFDVEDLAVALIKFENGATLEVEASWAANISENELMETRLFGTHGGLVQRNTDGGYKFEAEIYFEKDGIQYDMRPRSKPPEVKPAMHHFIDSILNDVPHPAPGEEGLIVMELLDAIYASAEQDKPVKI